MSRFKKQNNNTELLLNPNQSNRTDNEETVIATEDSQEDKKAKEVIEKIKKKIIDNEKTCIGTIDQPVDDDDFGIKKYYIGLTSFISKCVTPMTIAIQGDWGSGKSSVMQMVIKQIEDNNLTEGVKIHHTTVNTWQFSQFNSEADLSASLMQAIINGFEDKKKNSVLLKSIARIGVGLVKGVSSYFLEGRIGGFNTDNALNSMDSVLDNFLERNEIIQKLKERFQNCVYKAIHDLNVDRIAIFIDDLDRLEPERAVELLEVLKTFLDCKGCVFILAIDYNVVVSGVTAKYSEDKIDKEKGRSFFDKIIQVPFKMPTQTYDISTFVKNTLRAINIKYDDDTSKNYMKLIENSIGHNPRSMKRLFNSFVLQIEIANAEMKLQNDSKGLIILFATLCMQLQYENLYSYVLKNLDSDNLAFYEEITGDESVDKLKEYEILQDNDEALNEEQTGKIKSFMKIFNSVISPAEDGNRINPEDWNEAEPFISISSVTATETSGRKVNDNSRSEGKVRTGEINEWFKEYIDTTPGVDFTNPRNDTGTYLTFISDNIKNVFDTFSSSKGITGYYIAKYKVGIRNDGITIGPEISVSDSTPKEERKILYNKLKDVTDLGSASPEKLHSGGTRIRSKEIAPNAYTRDDITRETFVKMLDTVLEYDKKWFGEQA